MAGASISKEPDHSGVKFPPPLIYAGIFLFALILERFFPAALLRKTTSGVAAFVCIAGWLILTIWSIASFRRARTSFVPAKPATALVSSGPYRFSRNPMYVGFTVLYLGMAFLFAGLWGLILLPVLIAIIQSYVIAREEQYLERKFGEEYLRYKARVRRWI